jgi:hypothetical protein
MAGPTAHSSVFALACSCPVKAVTIEPARLDTLTTLLKGNIQPQDHPHSRARARPNRNRLESLDVQETGAKNRRRDPIEICAGRLDNRRRAR